MAKTVQYGGDNGIQIEIPEHGLVIGREVLNSNDKRMSRNHVLLKEHATETDTLIFIQSLHPSNPTFYRKIDATADSVLQKDESILLATGDKFRLIPEGDWCVVVNKDEAAHRVVETLDNQDGTETVDVNTNGNVEETIMANQTGTKRKYESANPTESEDCKRNRAHDDGTKPSASTQKVSPLLTHDADVPSTINIKPDPDRHTSTSAVTTENANRASTSDPHINIKPDPDGNGNQQIGSGYIVIVPVPNPAAIRPSCNFGIRCYRGGKDHRESLAHPGDQDYRRPNFPPAPPDAPFCPFGARCYRRNPAHFQEFQHLDPGVGTNDNVRPQRRAAAAVDPDHWRLYGDDDEYGDADFDDSSSDEFEPLGYEEDDYDSESEDEGLGCIDQE